MNGAAAALEIGTLLLAVILLVLDLAGARPQPAAPRRGLFAVAGVGLVVLLLASFYVPPFATLGPAFVQDPFALLIKRVMLAAAPPKRSDAR